MKEVYGVCKKCLGCGLEELDEFDGACRCNNFMSCERKEEKCQENLRK